MEGSVPPVSHSITMSLFNGNLAFADPTQIDAVKLGVLSGSLIAAVAGYLLLRTTLEKDQRA